MLVVLGILITGCSGCGEILGSGFQSFIDFGFKVLGLLGFYGFRFEGP